jgi:hypothetical protein
MILVTRRRAHPPTIAYIHRRTHEGKTSREAIRCLKRYLARSLYRVGCQNSGPFRGTFIFAGGIEFSHPTREDRPLPRDQEPLDHQMDLTLVCEGSHSLLAPSLPRVRALVEAIRTSGESLEGCAK